jgi:hypothetical protein
MALLTLFTRRGDSLTPVKAESERTNTIHLAFDHGSYDSAPLCGVLRWSNTETTDTPANCGRCAAVARQLGRGDDLRDELGWTGLYEPRR